MKLDAPKSRQHKMNKSLAERKRKHEREREELSARHACMCMSLCVCVCQLLFGVFCAFVSCHVATGICASIGTGLLLVLPDLAGSAAKR